ncbi:MAG TPA: hypothetical protein IAB35_03480 [Candidatus Faecimonas gallistercoris]|nr:hypothetical protein [Candidatus Faecimonas gallistercoris]
MSEEKITAAIKNAMGNNKIEGYDVTPEERELIETVLQKYEGEYKDRAIKSLLYGLAMGTELQAQEKTYEKHKK